MEYKIVICKWEIENSLKKIIKQLFDLDIEPQVELQSNLSKGDFSTNVVLTVFAKLKNQNSKFKSPMELGEKIVERLREEKPIYSIFDEIKVAPPGFINFWLSDKEVVKQIELVLDFGEVRNRNVELILEFGDLNPFKEPHIGH